MGAEWAQAWDCWCATTRPPERPVGHYAAVPLDRWGPETHQRPKAVPGAGPERLWDEQTTEWLHMATGPHVGSQGDVSLLLHRPLPPCLRAACGQHASGHRDG